MQNISSLGSNPWLPKKGYPKSIILQQHPNIWGLCLQTALQRKNKPYLSHLFFISFYVESKISQYLTASSCLRASQPGCCRHPTPSGAPRWLPSQLWFWAWKKLWATANAHSQNSPTKKETCSQRNPQSKCCNQYCSRWTRHTSRKVTSTTFNPPDPWSLDKTCAACCSLYKIKATDCLLKPFCKESPTKHIFKWPVFVIGSSGARINCGGIFWESFHTCRS